MNPQEPSDLKSVLQSAYLTRLSGDLLWTCALLQSSLKQSLDLIMVNTPRLLQKITFIQNVDNVQAAKIMFDMQVID